MNKLKKLVPCFIENLNERQSREIQELLFNLDCTWCGDDSNNSRLSSTIGISFTTQLKNLSGHFTSSSGEYTLHGNLIKEFSPTFYSGEEFIRLLQRTEQEELYDKLKIALEKL